ncbi:hypothetical protein ABZY16_35455 [Streptomyces sp. NPDC006553]|uniref:hypothetical protein n=1 Tax=Streptomyces sp. NPDC006553 TaxID=3157180 RepID=UPI0033A7CE6B
MNQIDVPFGEAVERFCANCWWPLSTDSPILPLGAAVSEVASLTIWLDREPEDEEGIEAERDAAIALPTGDYPLTNDVGDAEEDDETGHDEERERYDRARSFRSGRHSHWRRLHSYLTRSNEAVAEYPFLAPWADGLQSRLTAVLGAERRAFAALAQPARLLEAAAVRVLPTPLFSGDPSFAGGEWRRNITGPVEISRLKGVQALSAGARHGVDIIGGDVHAWPAPPRASSATTPPPPATTRPNCPVPATPGQPFPWPATPRACTEPLVSSTSTAP